MNRRNLILIGSVLILSAAVVLLLSVFYHAKPPAASSTGSTFPQSSGITAAPTYAIADANGNPITVHDFIHAPDTIPDVENKGNYLLAGTLGYCLPDMRCTAATSTDFNIGYDDKSKSFTIALIAEPLSQSRKEAEQFLMNQLGLTETQMCSLKYYVGTTYWINEQYDSKNLGFSFCPGAVKLP